MRRYAAPYVWKDPYKPLVRQVVEVGENGMLQTYYPLEQELPFTQWLQGALLVLPAEDDPRLHADDLLGWWQGNVCRANREEIQERVWFVSEILELGKPLPERDFRCLSGR